MAAVQVTRSDGSVVRDGEQYVAGETLNVALSDATTGQWRVTASLTNIPIHDCRVDDD